MLFAAVPAPAQIVDAPANDAMFVNGGADNTVTTNLGSRKVFVGKDDLASLTTLTVPTTITIGSGADSWGLPLLAAPDGRRYSGANVFGTNRIDVRVGNVTKVRAFHSSTVTVAGGSVSDLAADASSSVAPQWRLRRNGSTTQSASVEDDGTCDVTGGQVAGILYGRGNGIAAISGGEHRLRRGSRPEHHQHHGRMCPRCLEQRGHHREHQRWPDRHLPFQRR